MILAEIKNWKELVELFGLENKPKGTIGAKEISRRLKKEIETTIARKQEVSHKAIYCSNISEFMAIFKFIGKRGEVYVYEYTGVVN